MHAYTTLLDELARAPERREPTLEAHLAHHAEITAAFECSVARALCAGHVADRIGHAFASGYVEALCRLDPRARRVPMAIAVTERGGGHPRAIETRAEPAPGGARLHGRKSFVTLADHAERVFVVASEGAREDGTPILGVYDVSLTDRGVHREDLPETPFAPEIRHAAIVLDGALVPAEARLPGDGYLDYVKPFRTIEDLHVLAALVGHRLALSRALGLGAEDLSRGLALAAALLGLAHASPKSPATHLALDRVFDEARAFVPLDAEALAKLGAGERERFVRDLPLFGVADKARAARARRARDLLAQD
jgi:acyl-CoA dehydrogenase